MRFYETLYIISPDLVEEDYRSVLEKFGNLVEKNKGVVIKVDEWGLKKLAYPVKKSNKGHYVLLQYCGGPDIIEALKRDFRLDERVLKFQTIKLKDHADPDALKAKEEEAKPKEEDVSEPETAEAAGENEEMDTQKEV